MRITNEEGTLSIEGPKNLIEKIKNFKGNTLDVFDNSSTTHFIIGVFRYYFPEAQITTL